MALKNNVSVVGEATLTFTVIFRKFINGFIIIRACFTATTQFMIRIFWKKSFTRMYTSQTATLALSKNSLYITNGVKVMVKGTPIPACKT